MEGIVTLPLRRIWGCHLFHVPSYSHRWTRPSNRLQLCGPSRRHTQGEMLADAWPVLQRPSLGFNGSAYITGRSKSSFTATKGVNTTWVAFASKKGRQSQKNSVLDREKDLASEADLQYKPLGFGQGKAYDTALEDKLLEELEREKAGKKVAAQKQKNIVASSNGSKVKSTSEHPAIVDGIKVWVGDLPKKKNVDRDLRSAFRLIPGLLDISPSVLGNDKTRDPICKGFGFLIFDTVDHAKSFISSFQGRPMTFGKVEKKVTFRLVKANDGEVVPSDKKSLAEVGRLRIRNKEAGKVVRSNSNSESVSINSVGQNVLAAGNMQEAEIYQPEVEVIEDGEAVELHEDSYSEEEDSGDEYDLDDEPEFEISVELGQESAPRDWPQQAKNNDKIDAENNRIEELERRLKKKLEDGHKEAQKGEREEPTAKANGFTLKKTKAPKHSSSKGNNVAAVTHGLKKREREVMTGVLEKYGKRPSIPKR